FAAEVTGGRPIDPAGHVREWMPWGERRIVRKYVDQAFELTNVWKPPLAGRGSVGQATCAARESVHLAQGVCPVSAAEAAGILKPNQAGYIVGDGAIVMVGETAIGVGRVLVVIRWRLLWFGEIDQRVAAVVGGEIRSGQRWT